MMLGEFSLRLISLNITRRTAILITQGDDAIGDQLQKRRTLNPAGLSHRVQALQTALLIRFRAKVKRHRRLFGVLFLLFWSVAHAAIIDARYIPCQLPLHT